MSGGRGAKACHSRRCSSAQDSRPSQKRRAVPIDRRGRDRRAGARSTDLVGQLPFTPPRVTPKANVFDIVTRAAREFVEDVRGDATIGAISDDWPTLA